MNSSQEDLSPEIVKENNKRSLEIAPKELTLNDLSSGQQTPNPSQGRRLAFVGSYAVQCASCFKWRLVPTKQKYEEIRENLLEDYFVCEKAREWRPDISCEDAEDISQDGERLWAIDKPNITRPPSGWERIIKIRGEGSSQFADVYYASPSGKRFRSMVEVEKYLRQHPEFVDQGVKISQFSFKKPKPLHENYLKKRHGRFSNALRIKGMSESSNTAESDLNPVSRLKPDASTTLQLGRP